MGTCLPIRCPETALVYHPITRSLHSNGSYTLHYIVQYISYEASHHVIVSILLLSYCRLDVIFLNSLWFTAAFLSVETTKEQCQKYSVQKRSLFSLLTYLRSWALLEKLPIVQLLNNFPAFYGTRRFITVFTRALHLSLSWVRAIQCISSHPIALKIYFNIFHPPTSFSSSCPFSCA
jgi:hypothetical protein